MIGDWTTLCQIPGFALDGDHIDVSLGGRHQRVTVTEGDDSYLLSSFVARQSTVAGPPNIELQRWLRNRSTALVGFRIDARGRLVGEAWVPRSGLTAGEFQFCVRAVATECDRLRRRSRG